jgi:hypothetical protein
MHYLLDVDYVSWFIMHLKCQLSPVLYMFMVCSTLKFGQLLWLIHIFSAVHELESTAGMLSNSTM